MNRITLTYLLRSFVHSKRVRSFKTLFLLSSYSSSTSVFTDQSWSATIGIFYVASCAFASGVSGTFTVKSSCARTIWPGVHCESFSDTTLPLMVSSAGSLVSQSSSSTSLLYMTHLVNELDHWCGLRSRNLAFSILKKPADYCYAWFFPLLPELDIIALLTSPALRTSPCQQRSTLKFSMYRVPTVFSIRILFTQWIGET